MNIISKAWRAILVSPGWKTFVSTVSNVAVGVLSGTFVTEISSNSGLAWSTYHKTYSFYGLVVITFVLYLYNKSVYNQEKSVLYFQDSEYCVAYMRSQCLPEAAEKYKELIRNGQGGELKQAMDELRKVLK